MSSESHEGMPAISVLVPIYNVERYLAECLDSLLAQTFGNFEAILINDGSTDGSRDIIQRYLDADPRFRVIDKPNSGYGASMNRGLDEARGTYVGILESDDVFEPNALQVLYDAIVAAEADAAKANFYLYWSVPEVRLEPFELVSPQMAGRVTCPATDPDRSIFYAKPSIWSALYRRAFLERHGIRFLETPGASFQDTSFSFKVWAQAERACYLDAFVLKYRQDNEASSVNSPGKVYCVCDEYAEMSHLLDEDPSLDQQLRGVLCRMKFDSYMWNAGRLVPELRDEFLVRAREELRRDREAGYLDRKLFGWYKWTDLQALLDRPARFREAFATYGSDDPKVMLRHYRTLGGPGLGMQLMMRLAVRRLRG